MNTRAETLTLQCNLGDRHPNWLRIGAWLRRAGATIRLAPAPMVLLPFLAIVVEGVIQTLPSFGMAMSKLLTPLVGAWVLLMIHCRVHGHAFQPGACVSRLLRRWRALALLMLLAGLVFAFQCLVAALAGGPGAATGLAIGDIAGAGLTRAQLALVLASGALPMFVLFFAWPRLILVTDDVGQSLRDGLVTLAHWWRPALLATLVSSMLIAAAPWQPWLLLVLIPLGLHVGYAAYLDAFSNDNGK